MIPPIRGLRRAITVFAVVALTWAGASVARAVDEVPESPYVGGTLYLANANDLTDIAPDATLAYGFAVTGFATRGDSQSKFPNPTDATGVFAFLARTGVESDPKQWSAYAPLGELQPGGEWLPTLYPYFLLDSGTGTPSGAEAVKAAGGDYSLGIAFTRDNGLHVTNKGLFFVHIHVTAGSGDYTWTAIEATGPAVASAPSGGPSTTVPGSDSLLSFTAPTDQMSRLTVGDGRAQSDLGWTVTVGTGQNAFTVATGSGGEAVVDLGALGSSGAPLIVTLVSD